MRGKLANIPEFSERMRIIKGLLELSRAGKFNGLWTYNDATRLAIKPNGLPEPEHLGWAAARAMVDAAAIIKIEPRRASAPRMKTYRRA